MFILLDICVHFVEVLNTGIILKKSWFGNFFLWVKRVKKYEYRELIRALDLFFSHFRYELYFHFLKLIKENSKNISNWNKKGSTELWNPKKGNSGKKWHCFCPNAKINFFPSFAIWICTSRVVIGKRTGFWPSTDIRFKVWDVRINPII